MYYIYHVFNKKVGCTKNPIQRIEVEQRFTPSEYEIICIVDNIEEATQKEKHYQLLFGYQVELKGYSHILKVAQKSLPKLMEYVEKPIQQLDSNYNVVNEFKSGHEACRILNINRQALTHCLKGRQKTCGGFFWKFKN